MNYAFKLTSPEQFYETIKKLRSRILESEFSLAKLLCLLPTIPVGCWNHYCTNAAVAMKMQEKFACQSENRLRSLCAMSYFCMILQLFLCLPINCKTWEKNRGFLNLLKMSARVVCVLRAVSQPITPLELRNKTCFCLRRMILTQIMTDKKKQQRFIRNEKCWDTKRERIEEKKTYKLCFCNFTSLVCRRPLWTTLCMFVYERHNIPSQSIFRCLFIEHSYG